MLSLRHLSKISADVTCHKPNSSLSVEGNSTILRCSRGGLLARHQRILFSQRPDHKTQPPNKKVPFHEKFRDSILILEAKQGPVGKTFVGIGQGICTAGLVFGSGSLVYYTLFDQEQSKNDEFEEILPTGYWSPGGLNVPDYARDRVHTAYMYMLNSLGVSMVGAAASFRLFNNPVFLTAVSANPLIAIGITMGSQFAMTMFVRSLPYHEGFGLKQAGSVAQALLIGLSAAPMYLLGAQSIIRAGFVTAGLVGGLTGLSTILPRDSFVKWEIPLRLGMYTVFLSFMSLWFLPRRHFSYGLLYKVAMHGGLIVFPAYYLYNTKALVRHATYSPNFDPINSSMSMYTDTLNIYGRLAFLLPPHYFISGDTRNMSWASRSKSEK